MKLANLLDPRLVHIGADVRSVDEAIQMALGSITRLYKQEALQYDDVLTRVRERESLGGTAFKSGIAIPHGRIPGFNDFLIACIVPKEPIAPAAGQGEGVPVRIVYVILISQTASTLYLNSLAKLVESSRDAALMDALQKAEGGSQFVDLFDQAGYKVKEDLTVGDIMTREFVALRKDASVKELADLMYAKHLRYVPVVDDEGRFIGEVGLIDLIKAGIPDYAFRIGSLKFLSELEPMTELLMNEDKIKVEAIMQKKETGIAATASVIELAFEMTRNKKRHYAVVADGKLVGVVSAMDLLSKVLRA